MITIGKPVKVVLIVLLVGIMGVLVLQWRAKYLLQDYLLRKTPPHLNISYEDVSTNIFKGNVSFTDVSLGIRNKIGDLNGEHTVFKAKSFQFKGLGYLQMLFKNTIDLQDLYIGNPTIAYYPDRYTPSGKTDRKGVVGLLKNIHIGKIEIQKGSFNILRAGKDSIQVAIDSFDFELFGGRTDSNLVKAKIPLEYDRYVFKANGIFADLGAFEAVTVSEINASKGELSMDSIHLYTKYGKKELSRHLRTEHDHVDLMVPKINLEGLYFGFKEDVFGVSVSDFSIKAPQAALYRDKLVEDDHRTKPLYASLLRKMPIQVEIARMDITEGHLVYEEKVSENASAGSLFFSDLEADITGFSNHKDAETTQIKARAKLMGHAPLSLDWNFDVNAENDAFTASGSLSNLDASSLNPFFVPNLRSRAKGSVHRLYFTISGDHHTSHGDLQMKYDHFEFDVLHKDRLKVNKFLTAIGKVFVNDGSKNDTDGFRHGTIHVERETNKSFYNYLWVNVRNGVLSTLTGSGKKKE